VGLLPPSVLLPYTQTASLYASAPPIAIPCESHVNQPGGVSADRLYGFERFILEKAGRVMVKEKRTLS
jgi:hypothetical protein